MELVKRPGSVMCRKPEPEDPIIKKRKRPGKLEKTTIKLKLLKNKKQNNYLM